MMQDMTLQAHMDAMKGMARGVAAPAAKAELLLPAQAEAMVNCAHSGNRDYYLRHDTHTDIKESLFRLGCVGKRGADRRYWLGPYGAKVRAALMEDGE